MGRLNADLAAFAVVHTAEIAWEESPAKGIWRKRIYLDGPSEAGKVTSLVRFDAGARFPAHDHPQGEEILVLEGTFSDETGDYPAGHHLLNPDGSRHQPYSAEGCLLFVKLRQYPGTEVLRQDTNQLDWRPGRAPGISLKPLWSSADGAISVRLARIQAGTTVPFHTHAGGEEAFVIEGDIADERGAYGAGCWARYPPGGGHEVTTTGGCLLYVQTGGFDRA